MLDLDKHLEQWFDKTVGEEKCRFLLRYYSPEEQKKHLKACTIKSSKNESKLNDKKYVTMMVDFVIRDWEEVGGECNAENKKKFTVNYGPTVQELLDTAQIEGAFREQNSLELVKKYIGLSSIPTNGTKAKAEINQD